MDFLWIDVETTGLYSDKHDVVQLACIPVVGGQRQDFFNEFCQPKNWDAIDDGAINSHGITRQMMRGFGSQEKLLDNLVNYLDQFGTRFIIAGYNVDFDRRFIADMFSKCGRAEDFFRLFELNTHDVYKRVKTVKNLIKTENHKLETLAKHYNVPIKAHDAYSDINATIEVDKHVALLLQEEIRSPTPVAKKVDVSGYNLPEPAQLHLHSMYGMVDSVPKIQEWVNWCRDNNVKAYGVVDHGPAISMKEVVASTSDDIVGIPGVGLYFYDKNGKFSPFNAWAINKTGYINIMKLSSLAYSGDQVEDDGVVVPIVDRLHIEAHREGVVFGTGDIYGSIGEHLKSGKVESAIDAFNDYVEIFGAENLLVELIPVSIREVFSSKKGFQPLPKNEVIDCGDLGRAFNNFMFDQATKRNLKIIPSSNAYFVAQSDKLIHDVLAKRSYDSGKYYIESYHAKKGKDMYTILKQQLGNKLSLDMFSLWVQNTLDIADLVKNSDIKDVLDTPYHLPEIEIPEEIKLQSDDYDKQTLLYTISLCKKHGRWREEPEYVERFKKEISVIMKNGTLNFLPYFLLYEDICSYARSKGILQGIGRGSAGGCLLSYYLKIIHIDPIEADLPFERFLSFARIRAGSFPDIDCDFGDRTAIISYLQDKYGAGFAQICTLSTFKVKNAIKDAMWALYGKNRKDPNVEAVCKCIPDSPQGMDEYGFLYGFTNKEGEYTPGAIETIPELAAFFKQFSQVEEMVKRLIGLVRGWGRHASAFVISTLDLSSGRVPTMQMHDKHLGKSITVTQCEAHAVEGAGLVKADILGVTTIQSISDCLALIKERTGIDYLQEDEAGTALIYRLPEDERVYADFYNKKTDSSFQFNTSLIKGYVQQFAPTQREHLSVMTALCRPGALDAPFTNDEISLDDGISAAQYYMDVRNGKRKLSYLHPDLATCTSNGVFVYQEEVMKFLVDYAGYTLEEADQIRGAIAKKKHEVMMKSFSRIRENTAKRGWTADQSDVVCDMIQAFARYSFNRSHSRCYGELGYITMYLKNHHKLEWWASELNNSIEKEDKIRHYMTLLGSLIDPPSLAHPSKKFSIKGDKIIAPISALKGVGGASVDELVEKGPFNSLDDYIERVAHNKVNIGHFAALVKGRAADDFMSKELPYGEARLKLLSDYVAKRKCKQFKEDVMDVSPMSIFTMERSVNMCFNKSILEDKDLVPHVSIKDEKLVGTGRKGVPFVRGKTPVLSSLNVAKGLLDKDHDSEIGMIFLFEGSEVKRIVSKKNGKKYTMLKVHVSDGFQSTELTWWKRDKPLRIPTNSLVYVRGFLRQGWKTPVSINVEDLLVLSQNGEKNV